MGGAKKTVTGYKYYAGFQMILARLIHKILRVRVDKKTAAEGVFDGGIININMPDLFGGATGADAQGGLVAVLNFQQGLPDQLPDEYLQSKLGTPETGGQITASRGATGIVCRQGYLGNNPYMKEWEFRGERVHMLDDGTLQWYDEKAAIPVPAGAGSVPDQVGTFSVPAGSVYSNSGIVYGPSGPQTASADALGAAAIAARNTATGSDYVFGGSYYYLDSGVPSIGAWSTNLGPTIGISSTPANAMCEVNFNPNVEGTDGWLGLQSPTVRCAQAVPQVYQLNPAHILREILTNNEWGYGYDVSDLDDASFRSAADSLYLEQFGLGYFWDDESVTLDDLVDKIEAHIDAVVYVDRRTLLWTLKLIRADYDPDTLPTLTGSVEIISIEDFKRPQFMELTNTMVVNFYDMVLGNNSSITLPDPALLLQQGVKIDKQTNYDMICNRTLASRVAQRDLGAESSPLATGTLYLTPGPVTSELQRGKTVKVTMPEFDLDNSVVRITAISFGDGKTRRIKASFVEDKFALPETAIIPLTPLPPPEAGSVPVPLPNRLLMELPYYYLLRSFGKASVDSELAADPSAGSFGICAERVPGAYNANIYVDAGAGYTDDGTLNFCPFGVLTTAMGPLTSVATMGLYDDLEDVTADMAFQIDQEIMVATVAQDGAMVGIRRGLYDTTPTPHAVGAKVFFFQDYLDSDEVQYGDGDVVNVRLATVAAGGTLALSDAPTDTLSFDHRAIRPYPPGKLQINGAAYPSSVVGPFTVSWAHRNRLTQQDVPVDTTEGDVAPETGTTYTVRVYLNNVLDDTIAGVAGTTATVTPSGNGPVIVAVYAERDGFESWQGIAAPFTYSSVTHNRITRDGSRRVTRDGSTRITH